MTVSDLSAADAEARGESWGDALVRRLRGDYRVDEWGLDHDLFHALLPVARARWSIATIGAPHLPLGGPALLVYNRRAGMSEASVLTAAVHRSAARVVRHPGVPDRAPLGSLLRRVGGVVGRGDEIAGLLRADQLVGIPLAREVMSRHVAGAATADLLESAVTLRVPVIPVALVGFEVGWRWRVVVGAPLAIASSRAPLAATELAEQARDGVQNLLDDHVPARWPFS